MITPYQIGTADVPATGRDARWIVRDYDGKYFVIWRQSSTQIAITRSKNSTPRNPDDWDDPLVLFGSGGFFLTDKTVYNFSVITTNESRDKIHVVCQVKINNIRVLCYTTCIDLNNYRSISSWKGTPDGSGTYSEISNNTKDSTFPSITVVGSNQKVFIVFREGIGSPPNKLQLSTWESGNGFDVMSLTTIDDSIDDGDGVITSDKRGWLHVVYSDGTTTTLHYKMSKDSGTTWKNRAYDSTTRDELTSDFSTYFSVMVDGDNVIVIYRSADLKTFKTIKTISGRWDESKTIDTLDNVGGICSIYKDYVGIYYFLVSEPYTVESGWAKIHLYKTYDKADTFETKKTIYDETGLWMNIYNVDLPEEIINNYSDTGFVFEERTYVGGVNYYVIKFSMIDVKPSYLGLFEAKNVVYELLLNGDDITHKKPFLTATYKSKVNAAKSLKITFPNKDGKDTYYFKENDKIILYVGLNKIYPIPIFTGYIKSIPLDVGSTSSNLTISCFGNLSKLKDEKVWFDEELLEGNEASSGVRVLVSEVEDNQIEAFVIQGTSPINKISGVKIKGEDGLKVLSNVTNQAYDDQRYPQPPLPHIFYEENNTLFWRKATDPDAPNIVYIVEFQVSNDILTSALKRGIDEKYANACTCVSKNDENIKETYEDDWSQSIFGKVHKKITYPSNERGVLLAAAKRYVEMNKVIEKRFTINIPEAFWLNVGQPVKVTNNDYGISGIFIIQEMDINISPNGIDTKLTLSNKRPSILTTIKNI